LAVFNRLPTIPSTNSFVTSKSTSNTSVNFDHQRIGDEHAQDNISKSNESITAKPSRFKKVPVHLDEEHPTLIITKVVESALEDAKGDEMQSHNQINQTSSSRRLPFFGEKCMNSEDSVRKQSELSVKNTNSV
jgi:hypothetical protein